MIVSGLLQQSDPDPGLHGLTEMQNINLIVSCSVEMITIR